MTAKFYIDCLKCRGTGWVYVPDGYGCVASDHCDECDGTGKEECDQEYFEQLTNAGAIK